jgi:hypothetical protein
MNVIKSVDELLALPTTTQLLVYDRLYWRRACAGWFQHQSCSRTHYLVRTGSFAYWDVAAKALLKPVKGMRNYYKYTV